jgi:acetyltransferase-like isoleucine patch superfamily enzyme
MDSRGHGTTVRFLSRPRMARMLAAGSNDIPLLRTIRRHLLIKLLRAPNLPMGSHVRLDRSHPDLGGRRYLGSAVEIGPRCILAISGGIDIRDAVTVSEDSLLLSHDHNFDDPDVHWRDQGQKTKPLTIGEGAWIGARSPVVGARTIGAGAVIGGTSRVTRPVEPTRLALASPARPIRLRGTRRVALPGDE